jgi:hypothetical protein
MLSFGNKLDACELTRRFLFFQVSEVFHLTRPLGASQVSPVQYCYVFDVLHTLWKKCRVFVFVFSYYSISHSSSTAEIGERTAHTRLNSNWCVI